VCNPSTPARENKVWVIPIIGLALTRLGQRLFEGPDTRAHQHGWQVTPVQCGLGRRYRDARFDSLRDQQWSRLQGQPACGCTSEDTGRPCGEVARA